VRIESEKIAESLHGDDGTAGKEGKKGTLLTYKPLA
jgi:hypothetical protein